MKQADADLEVFNASPKEFVPQQAVVGNSIFGIIRSVVHASIVNVVAVAVVAWP